MKKLGLLVLITAFVFTVSVVEVYAATALTTGGTPATGDVTIALATFARQTTGITFTSSNTVYVNFAVSTSKENYTVSACHKNGNKAYGMDSTGGPTWYIATTAGTTPTFAIMGPVAASDTGAATWTSWTAQ